MMLELKIETFRDDRGWIGEVRIEIWVYWMERLSV